MAELRILNQKIEQEGNYITSLIDRIRNERFNAKTLNETKKRFYIDSIANVYLPKYWKDVIQRDLPNITGEIKKDILQYMQEYIKMGIKERYFTDENILDVLKQLTLGIKSIYILQSGIVYGDWSGFSGSGQLGLDITKNKDSLKHVIFHEFTHCITPNLGNVNENYRSIWNINQSIFIRELMAEATANDFEPGMKIYSPVYAGNVELKSYYPKEMLWNRQYQQLGAEFLETLSFTNTEDSRFKALTKLAINPNNEIANMIADEYIKIDSVNGLNDLKMILDILGSITRNHSIDRDSLNLLRKKMSKYKSKITIFKVNELPETQTLNQDNNGMQHR